MSAPAISTGLVAVTTGTRIVTPHLDSIIKNAIVLTDGTNAGTLTIIGGKAKGSVTAQIQTLTLGGALVAANVVALTVDGVALSVTYASSSDATLQALADLIAAQPNVASATVTVVGGTQVGADDRVITVTSSTGVPVIITGISITGGAGQTTLTLAETQAPAGHEVLQLICAGADRTGEFHIDQGLVCEDQLVIRLSGTNAKAIVGYALGL